MRSTAPRFAGPSRRRCTRERRKVRGYARELRQRHQLLLMLVLEWGRRLRLVAQVKALRCWHRQMTLGVLGAEEIRPAVLAI